VFPEEAAPPGLTHTLEEKTMRPTIETAHTSVLRWGTLALSLFAVAPAIAGSWRGPMPVPTPPPDDEILEERASTSAPATLVGEVLVRSDAHGRLAVLVDEALRGRTSRGAATRLFLLTPRTPLAEPIEVRLGLASVIFRGDSLHVSATSRRYTVDAALLSRSDGRRTVGPDGLVVHDGIALQSLRLAGAPVPVEEVLLDDRPSVLEEAPESAAAAGACQAGGAGSSTCSKKCSMTLSGFSFIDECSVECTAGYHACCNCIVPREGATCTCVKDEFVGPRQPGGVKGEVS
jgi:hypothetical protein